ncbi:hypothetical protein [Gelidibacter salicanalis]|uniref:Uncharacterized protein n=1 Tax=Gelidibacter salicanalis TaxID=291193 RepID=A0A934KRQ8_9FLAO|nr:hypothetical protein [Gelidibacter salicanalis]MBJ7882309.1 hypothetical protein [Gelidibacter salicanalis]
METDKHLIWKYAYFVQKPLKTKKQIKEYMEDLGIVYYETKVEITIDALNVNLKKLNKEHELYEKILEAKENEVTHFKFSV